MPAIELKTNVAVADPKSLVLELSELSATTLNKPLHAVCASYTYNEFLTFDGSFDPVFMLVITSLYNLSPENNEVYSKAYFEFLEKKLGVPGNRAYITFLDPGSDYMGAGGMTITNLRAKRAAETK